MPDSGTVSTVSETIEDVSKELAGGVESGTKLEIALGYHRPARAGQSLMLRN